MFAHSLILAEASAQFLDDWLSVIMKLCAIILAVAGVWKLVTKGATKTEISGQPIDVRAHPGVATQAELRQVHGRIERERAEINAAIRSVAEASEKRTDKMERSLNENTALTQRTSAEVSMINQNVQTLTHSLTNFLRDQANK